MLPKNQVLMAKRVGQRPLESPNEIRRPSSAPPRSNLPLVGQIYYLDVSEKKKSLYSKQIEFLGGTVSRELDFGQITHVLTSRSPRPQSPSPLHAQTLALPDSSNLPARSPQISLVKSTGAITRPASPAAGLFASMQGSSKRSQKLAEILSSVSSQPAADLLAQAKQHNKKIYHVDQMGPWLQNSCDKIMLRQRAATPGNVAMLKRVVGAASPSIAPTEAAGTDTFEAPATQSKKSPSVPRAAPLVKAPTPVRPHAKLAISVGTNNINNNSPQIAAATTGATTGNLIVASGSSSAQRHPHVVVRDKHGYFPPAMKEFPPIVMADPTDQQQLQQPSYPILRVDNPPGTSLFAVLSPQERAAEIEKFKSRKRKYDEAQADERLKREFDEARRKKLKVRPDKENLLNFPLRPKSGYCECCCKRYDDFDTVRNWTLFYAKGIRWEEHSKMTFLVVFVQHVAEESHRQFAQDDSNYTELDQLIRTVNAAAEETTPTASASKS